MITLEAADLIEGDASAASAVDYTINGVEEASSVVSVKALADGQLPSSKGTLYTCPASTTAIIKSIILVNTDSSARTVNLYTQRDGSNSRRIIPENLSLEANGGTAILADQLYVFSASGELLYKVTQDIHALGGSAHSADTLANLNSKISDATLDDSSASRTPTAHKSSHATGGADELYLQDLEHTAADATLHDSLTSTPHVSAAEKTTWNGKIANVVEDTTPQLGGDLDAQTKRIYDVKVLDFKAPTELTIAAGAITVTQTFHTVDTEADAATDDLATINGGSDGRLIVLKAVNDARTVVVKHNTGNIWLQGKADISLDDISDGLMLVYSATDSKWFDIAAGGGGGGGLNNVVEDTTPQLGGDLDCQTKRLYDIKLFDLKAPTELTISSGAITITQSQHTVDTEGDAATDDLDTINGGGSAYGRLLFIRPAADTRTIVVKHNTGNIWLKGKADLSLDEVGDGLLLIFTGSGWLDVGTGGGGGGGAHNTSHEWLGADEVNLRFNLLANPLKWSHLMWINSTGWANYTTGSGSVSRRVDRLGLRTLNTSGSKACSYIATAPWVDLSVAGYRWHLGGYVEHDVNLGVTSNVVRIGLWASATAPTDTAKHYGWKIVNGLIYASCGNGASGTQTSTGVTMVGGTASLLIIRAYSNQIKFYVDNVLKVTLSTNLPSAGQLYCIYWIQSTGVADRWLYINPQSIMTD